MPSAPPHSSSSSNCAPQRARRAEAGGRGERHRFDKEAHKEGGERRVFPLIKLKQRKEHTTSGNAHRARRHGHSATHCGSSARGS